MLGFVQRRAVGKLVTLPKKMLPLRLQLFKQLLLKGPNSLRPAAATGVAGRTTTVLDRPHHHSHHAPPVSQSNLLVFVMPASPLLACPCHFSSAMTGHGDDELVLGVEDLIFALCIHPLPFSLMQDIHHRNGAAVHAPHATHARPSQA